MRKRSLFFVAVAVILLPAHALAATVALCLQDNTANATIYGFNFIGEPGGFFRLFGEAFNVCGATPVESSVMIGNAHIRADGQAHVALWVSGSTTCLPQEVQAVVNLTTLSGPGTLDQPSTGAFQNITLAPAATCPAATLNPQQ